MTTKYHQISLCETFSDCQNQLIDNTPSFFQVLSEHFDFDEFIPSEFQSAFYRSIGRTRIYSLHGFLSAFILQKIFSIPTDSLLLLFLNLCKELRDFCGFSKVPDASLLSRFKHDFESYIELMFQQMVDYTEPICQMIDSSLANLLTFDTSGIELYVTENNPKTLNALIKKLITKIIPMLILTKWLMGLCLHRLLLVRMQNRCTSMGISVTLTSLLFLPMI